MALLSLFLFLAFIPKAMPRQEPATRVTSMLLRHEQWMEQFDRVYSSTAERTARFEIFKSNVEFIESFNRNSSHKYKLGVNQFADLTTKEFSAMINNTVSPPTKTKLRSRFRYRDHTDVPESKDWRSEGVITPIKNQLSCGSCWAFAGVATIEAITAIRTGNLTSLSEQQLLDCDTKGENKGCRGGNAAAMFQFVVDNGGLTTEESYPYQAIDSNVCRATSNAATITSYEGVPSNDEAALMKAVARQPVHASINVGSAEFQLYGGGVFHGPCGGTAYHAVAVIGYGAEEDGTKYWLVKNSWGTGWGEGGFGKIARGAGASGSGGMCSIASWPIYPIAS